MPRGKNKTKYRSMNTVSKEGSTIGIYNLKGLLGKSQIRIEHTENLSSADKDKIVDDLLEEYVIDQDSCIRGKIFKCNITNHSLTISKKQPMMYVLIYLDKPLKTAILFNITLYFTIDLDANVKIRTQNQFLSMIHNGSYSLEVIKDGQTSVLDKQIDTYPGEDSIKKILKEFSQTADMIEVLKEIAQIEEEKIAEKYKTNFDMNDIPVVTATLELDDFDVDDYY